MSVFGEQYNITVKLNFVLDLASSLQYVSKTTKIMCPVESVSCLPVLVLCAVLVANAQSWLI